MPYLSVLGRHFEKPLSYLKLAPSNLPYCKIWCKKTKFLNLGPKMLDFHILGLELKNIIVIFKTSVLQFALLQSLMLKQKSSDLGPKMSDFGIFGLEVENYFAIFEISNLSECLNLGPRRPYLGTFGLEFENDIAIFGISTLEFVYLQNFAKKQKCLNLGPKMPYLGIFGPQF